MMTSWYSAGSDEADPSTYLVKGIIPSCIVSFSKDVDITWGIVQETFVGFSDVL